MIYIKNYIKKNNLLFFFLGTFLLYGCDSISIPSVVNNPNITFREYGFNTVERKLEINSSGFAVYTFRDYEMSVQLSDKEFNEIKLSLINIEDYQDHYSSSLIDDSAYEITVESEEINKTVIFGSYSIQNYPELDLLTGFARVMLKLCDRIYEEKSPWKGLEYHFSMDKSEYILGEVLQFSCKIKNILYSLMMSIISIY